jgi:LPS export ABC transporter permease LptG
MKYFSLLISKYLVKAVLPYFFLSWVLLSVILFVQQASRYSDIFFNINIPNKLIWQLTFALVPNVIAFTCPMAVLVGVIIGLSRMKGDSELISIKAAGVGNLQILIPIVVLGIFLSVFAFFVNLNGVPFAAKIVRSVALQTALYKLESPIEPGVFNTEISGFTIYVKDGDVEKGTWNNVFIHSEDPKTNQVRLITSSNGRIDSNKEISELVLDNAIVSTFSTKPNEEKVISENIGQIRFKVKTKRNEVVEKISNAETTPEQLGLGDLAKYAKSRTGNERIEAEIIWYRRIILSITPLIFALLGTALVLRYNRGGRGFGLFLALISLVTYYLITLLGEQLTRTNYLNVFFGAFLPVFLGLLTVGWFFLSGRVGSNGIFEMILGLIKKRFKFDRKKMSGSSFYIDWTTGLLDLDIITNLLKYFLLTFSFLTAIYLIFTAFELWKFAGNFEGGVSLLIKYLLYLLPFIYIQLAPSALMIATLATYAVKSRQNEVVTWTASGQSIYRLLIPCFFFMILIGFVNWGIQETIAPRANQIQDELRAQIRSRGVMAKQKGKLWVAENNRIYSFELADGNNTSKNREVKNLSVYEFSEDELRLKAVYSIPSASWQSDKIIFSDKAEKFLITANKIESENIQGGEFKEDSNPFKLLPEKPSHLSVDDTKSKIDQSESEIEKRTYAVALQKKYTTLVLPFIITLFTAPFALSLNRKGKVITIGYAVALWLLFMGITNTFEQFGLNGFISPSVAVWFPLILFSIVGTYLMSKVRT